MRPSKDKFYWVDILELHSVITTIIKEFQVEFTAQDLRNLCLVCKDFALLVPKITMWWTVDCSLLREPRFNYEQQEWTDPHRVKMASAAMVHFSLNPGICVQWMGGEYTGYHRDVQRTLVAVHPHVMAKNNNHIEQILLDSCPTELMFTESLENNLKTSRQWNSKSFDDHRTLRMLERWWTKKIVTVTLCLLMRTSVVRPPHLRHTIQTVVMKQGKNNHLVWDGTTILLFLDMVMNQVTPATREAPNTFGHIEIQIYQHLQHMHQPSKRCHPVGNDQHQGMFSLNQNSSRLNWRFWYGASLGEPLCQAITPS